MSKKKGIRSQNAASIMASGFFRLTIYICAVFAVIFLSKTAYDFGYDIFNDVPMEQGEGTEITVVVPEGVSVHQIGKLLEGKDLIKNPGVFLIQEKLSNYKGRLQPGTYILNTNMTSEEIMAILSRDNVEGQPSEEVQQENNSAVQEDQQSE